jgi:hypothetical protein
MKTMIFIFLLGTLLGCSESKLGPQIKPRMVKSVSQEAVPTLDSPADTTAVNTAAGEETPSPLPTVTPTATPSPTVTPGTDPAPPVVVPTMPVTKKGVGTWNVAYAKTAMDDLKVGWFFNWTGESPLAGVSAYFVPMIYAEKNATEAVLSEVGKSSGHLMGFYEPGKLGGPFSVERALELWPAMMKTGMKLGSPVVADPSDVWFKSFMQGVQQHNYTVDFIALRWYGTQFNPDVAIYQLKKFLEQAHSTYQRPIWLVEYALTRQGGTPLYPDWETQALFARKSVELLESLPYVQKYAWFSLPKQQGVEGATTYLYDQDGVATKTGIAYRDAGAVTEPGNEPDQVQSGVNLLTGAGFETGQMGYWGAFGQLDAGKTTPQEGTSYASFKGSLSTSLARLIAGTYDVSCFVRGNKSMGMGVYDLDFKWLEGNWSVQATSSWQKVSFSVTLSGEGAQDGLQLWLYNNNDAAAALVDVDDCEVKLRP